MLSACATQTEENKVKINEWMTSLVTDNKTRAATKRAVRRGIEVAVTPKREVSTVASAARVDAAKHVEIEPVTLTNKKPREFVEKWLRAGLNFQSYKEGINPFSLTKNNFAIVAMQAFMERKTLTKDDLIDVFVEKIKWGLGTASSHTNIIFETFEYLGIITTSGKTARLRD